MHSILIHFSYQEICVALCAHEKILGIRSFPHRNASGMLIMSLEELLAEQHLVLDQLTYLAANCGPGPFTTLRTILATINGLGYATKLPLIGLNMIEVFATSYHRPLFTHTVALLYAFGNDVYYAQHDNGTTQSGCSSFEAWLDREVLFREQHPDARIQYLGNGVIRFASQLIEKGFIQESVLPDIPDVPDVTYMAQAACDAWKRQHNVSQQHQLSAIYGKSAAPVLSR